MMLVEETQVAEAALPVDALKTHLRLGSGFSETDLQDAVLVSFLRAALAAIEARTSRALIQRDFVLTFEHWQDPAVHRLPIAPVQSITDVTVIDGFGVADTVAPESYRLVKDGFAPKLRAMALLPTVPQNGSVEIRFQAGFGPSFDDVPDDLKQAVLLLAAHYYEYRDETALGQGCMPFGVTSLIAPYRPVRVGLGA
ncbi:head-tail connector protein [Sagittula sp. SSi028]|uniref:head-tail connector protein n=1 Tax=Sagittula sp. SSi028 TaxID=3400636 RepID=UPI003AF9B591